MTKSRPSPGRICRVTDGPSGSKITCAFIYSSTHNVTGTIKPGETVLDLEEILDGPGAKYTNIMWRSGTWWIHSAFLEEE